MAFSSKLHPDEPLIDDSTPFEIHSPDGCGRGLIAGRGASAEYGAVAQPVPKELLIDPSEFQARIQEKEEKQNRTSDLIRQKKLPSKNQRSLNYCWAFAPTHALEIIRMQQNEPYVSLSPASVGGPLKNWRNVGGMGFDALARLVDYGAVPSANFPDTDLDRRLLTPENLQLALNYRVTGWWELQPRNMTELVSLLLRNIPVPVGYDWWEHEVTAVDAVWINGAVAIRIRNQWWPDGQTPWGDDNFAVLQGRKAIPDDAVAPAVAIAS